jgi:hypothetical protein
MSAKPLLAALLLAGLAGCTPPPPPGPDAAIPNLVTVGSQPINVGDTKNVATTYHDDGSYDRGLAEVDDRAAAWIAERAPLVPKPALVLDIDETALSNWEVIRADDFGRVIGGPCTALPEGPCGWASWDQLGRDPPIVQTLRVAQLAMSKGVAVFMITGRPENQRAATERNLRNAGYGGYTRMYMVPDGAHFASAVDFKTPRRIEIEQQGYQIIANIGDQPSDLIGGHAERVFLLPDPFYRIP